MIQVHFPAGVGIVRIAKAPWNPDVFVPRVNTGNLAPSVSGPSEVRWKGSHTFRMYSSVSQTERRLRDALDGFLIRMSNPEAWTLLPWAKEDNILFGPQASSSTWTITAATTDGVYTVTPDAEGDPLIADSHWLTEETSGRLHVVSTATQAGAAGVQTITLDPGSFSLSVNDKLTPARSIKVRWQSEGRGLTIETVRRGGIDGEVVFLWEEYLTP